MKTKEFIKLLKEEDPTGESHIRINGKEAIIGVESKPGYWDGPYDYIEKGEDGNPVWIASTKGNKIDIHSIDLYDFAERYDGNWNEIKNHIKVEYTYLDSDERKNNFIKNAKKECDEFNKIKEEVTNIMNKNKK